MSERYLDTMAERNGRAAMVRDVQAFDPAIKVGGAKLNIMSGWKQHDDRWMEWSYTDAKYGTTKIDGYFHSAHGAHEAGWREFLATNMTPAQYAGYQDGDDRAWIKPSRRTPR